ncbi:MAG: aminotransferase class IV family protein [Pasteurellaceae bacterium]|nr:aminotransferase class IV family protein [Pasteurellaceae bacterium]
MDFPLFETLCLEQGKLKNIALHQARYEHSLHQFYAQTEIKKLCIFEQITQHRDFTQAYTLPLVRCRFAYNQTECDIQFFPYQRKKYQTFQQVICNEIEYSLKYNQRDTLNHLFAQRGNCDEIIIIKQGKVTDCSIGNLVFRKGSEWFTPDSPLLAGTQRAHLLQNGKIQVRPIFAQDISTYDEIRLINALNPL